VRADLFSEFVAVRLVVSLSTEDLASLLDASKELVETILNTISTQNLQGKEGATIAHKVSSSLAVRCASVRGLHAPSVMTHLSEVLGGVDDLRRLSEERGGRKRSNRKARATRLHKGRDTTDPARWFALYICRGGARPSPGRMGEHSTRMAAGF